jgi:magnesium-transporting ATPase (P-type)
MAALRRGAWIGLKYVTTLFFIGVIVQFFLVGYGLFNMKHGATIDNAKSLDPHRGLGFILSDFGSILMLILVLLAWPKPRRLLYMWILLAVLAFVQGILATVGFHHWGVGMFHPVNALLLLGLSGHLARYAWKAGKATSAEEAPALPATTPSG